MIASYAVILSPVPVVVSIVRMSCHPSDHDQCSIEDLADNVCTFTYAPIATVIVHFNTLGPESNRPPTYHGHICLKYQTKRRIKCSGMLAFT